MSDNNMEPTPSVGTPATPKPGASPEGVPTSAIDVDALAKALEPTLAKLVEKQWQSGKDSRISKLQGKVDDFDAQLARFTELVGEGMSQKRARQWMKVEQLLASQGAGEKDEPQAAPQVTGGNRQQQAPGVETAQLLNVLGLSDSDQQVMELVREGVTDPNRFVQLAIQKKQAQTAAPNPAGIAPAGGGGGVDTTSLESVTADLQRALSAEKKDYELIKKLQKQHRELLPLR